MSLTFSNSPLWSECAMSMSPAAFELQSDDEAISEERQEGSAAAWMADCVIRGSASSCAEFEGETAPNGWPIDPPMITHVQGYVDTVRPHGRLQSETELSLWNGLVKGRVDTHVIDSPSGALRIWELKYGYKLVEPEGNPQLLLPAIALLKPHHNLITLAIYQPRPQHPAGVYRKSVIDRATLANAEARLYQAAIATMDARPNASPGHHCADAYCPRAGSCAALNANLYRAFSMLSDNRKTAKLTPGELAKKLAFLETIGKLLKATNSATNAEAEARLKAQEQIPGYCMEPRTGERVWTQPAAVIRELTGIDPVLPGELKSPAQMEREGASLATVKMLTTQPSRGQKLAKWKPATIKKAFGE